MHNKKIKTHTTTKSREIICYFLHQLKYMVVSDKDQGPIKLNSIQTKDWPWKLLTEPGSDLYSDHPPQ